MSVPRVLATVALTALEGFLTTVGGIFIAAAFDDGVSRWTFLGIALFAGPIAALLIGRRRAPPDRRPSLALQVSVFVATVVLSFLAFLSMAMGGGRVSPERIATADLKSISSAEADFRANDRDGNKVNDFWTGDVAGLYSMTALGSGNSDEPIRLIESSLAAADASPLPPGSAGGEYGPPPADRRPGTPRAGYLFVAMTDGPGGRYRMDTEGAGKAGAVHNVERFAFCAYPAKEKGRPTFIINEEGLILKKATGGQPVVAWPKDPAAEGWSRLD